MSTITCSKTAIGAVLLATGLASAPLSIAMAAGDGGDASASAPSASAPR